MPKVPFKRLSYDDVERGGLNALADAHNIMVDLLDQLLNRQNLDSANINPTNIYITPADPDKPSAIDTYGANPAFVRFYRNQAYNWSFEVFDDTTKIPDYWSTTGAVIDTDSFDGDHCVQLDSGEYIEMAAVDGAGLPDPANWPWSARTRFSFRAKGASGAQVTASVSQGGSAVNLKSWTYNSAGEEVEVGATSFALTPGADWPTGLLSLAALPNVSGGGMKLRIENTGSVAVKIDAVVVEPDWTGKYPSIGNDGPEAAAASGGGGGVRPATVVIAASNSLDSTGADYVVAAGADAAVTFAEAIAAIKNGGAASGQILLLDGTFEVGQQTLIDAVGIAVKGMGASTEVKIKDGTSTSFPIWKITAAKVQIKDMVWNGNDANVSGSQNGVEISNMASYPEIEGIIAHNFTTDVIYGSGCVNASICGSVLADNASGIYLEDGSGNRVSENTFTGNASYGVYAYGETNLRIQDNVCSQNDYGIENYGGFDIEISGNICKNHTSDGIETRMTRQNTVVNNICSNNTCYGISGVANYSTFENNICISNTYEGILMAGTHNTFNGNLCKSNADGGMTLSGEGLTVMGNTCCDNSDVGIGGSGAGSVVSGNRCYHNNAEGINWAGAGSTVTGNTCNSNDYGINFYGGDNSTLTGNTCNNNTSYGINMGASNSTAVGNTCKSNGTNLNNYGSGNIVEHNNA